MLRRGTQPDWGRLVLRAQVGDRRAWDQIFEGLSGMVYSIARRHRLSPDDAEDVFQQTFEALYRNLDRIDDGGATPKWVAVTAARASLKARRVAGKTQQLETNERDLTETLADEEAGADEIAALASQALTLRNAVAAMGGKCGPLLTLLYLEEDMSYQIVGEKLAMPLGTIGPTRARCLEKLRAILIREEFFS